MGGAGCLRAMRLPQFAEVPERRTSREDVTTEKVVRWLLRAPEQGCGKQWLDNDSAELAEEVWLSRAMNVMIGCSQIGGK